MKRTALCLALMFAAGASQAHGVSCGVESPYDLELERGEVAFVRGDGDPGRVEFGRDGLRIDGRLVVLGEADRARLARYSREVKALAPEVQAIALDAVEIAFVALSEVARGLSDDADDTVAKLSDARGRVERELRASSTAAINEDVIGDAVGDVVAELVPALVGDIVQSALSAAFSGDTAAAERLEARAARMERDIERRIEPRARALEARAEALCERVAALDAIEAELDYRLPNGERLDLLRSGPE